MKILHITILCLLLLSNSLRVSLVYSWYVLDIDSFIEQLCENKDKPELQCNGKCYLTKVADKSTENQEQPMPVIEWDQVVYCNLLSDTIQKTQLHSILKKNHYYLLKKSSGVSFTVFHPPKV